MASWYQRGLRFACTGCGACCRVEGPSALLALTPVDVARLARHQQLPEDRFRERHVVTTVALGDALRLDGDACPFLDDSHRCRVYAARPRQCRLWPFCPETLQSRDAWEEEVVGRCPGAGQGPRHAADEIERIAEMEED